MYLSRNCLNGEDIDDYSPGWENSDMLKRVWADDLGQLMRAVPPFDRMFHELRTLFEKRMPETL